MLSLFKSLTWHTSQSDGTGKEVHCNSTYTQYVIIFKRQCAKHHKAHQEPNQSQLHGRGKAKKPFPLLAIYQSQCFFHNDLFLRVQLISNSYATKILDGHIPHPSCQMRIFLIIE